LTYDGFEPVQVGARTREGWGHASIAVYEALLELDE